MQNSTQLLKEVATVTTDELIDILSSSFIAHIEGNLVSKHPSVFIQGQPGVGKSQAVYQISKNIEQQTNKRVKVTDVRLLLFTPVDLRGIPIADKESKTSIWLRPEIFQLENNENVVHLFFLDELTAAPSSIQAAAYQIALERRLGEHILPENTFIIAAGNRSEDRAISYEMPTALRNRFMHFEVIPDIESWLDWAKKHHIHPEILEFLSEHPDKFYTQDLNTSSSIIVTPRSWEMLSNLLYRFKGSQAHKEIMISSLVGSSIAYLMTESIKAFNIEKILNGDEVDAPSTMGEIQGITVALENKLSKYLEDKIMMNHVLRYLLKMPADYALRLFQKIVQNEPQNYELSELENYHKMIQLLEDHA